ncbi:MAG: glycerophosphodiester phosphodiesterase family protein, partial [Myxococcota bacterium]
MPSRPRLYAHRGAAVEQPENTLPAFHRALERGADALEMDIHMTADGHIVVSHDPSGRRMAGVAARYCDATLSDIKRWDLGYGFVDSAGERPFAGRGYCVPTFEEVLRELPDVPLNVDIKQVRPSPVPRLLELLRRTGNCERVTLASFHARNLLAVRRRGYEGPTALSQVEVASLLALPARVWARQWRTLGGIGTAAQLPTRGAGIRMDTHTLLDKCHRLGLRVDYWTINDPAEARRLL